MGRVKRDKKKTKAQLIEELNELRQRVAQLEGQSANGESHAHTNGDAEASAPPTEMQSLHRIAESVERTLRALIPQEVEIRLSAEERLGLVHADPGVAEQLIVQLFLTSSKPRPNA